MSAAPTRSDTVVAQARGLGKTFAMHPPWTDRLLSRTAPRRIHAVEDVSFAISRGRTLALVGESGCGKTTLARLMVGLEAPTAGSARVEGLDVQATLAGPASAARALRQRMQMIFQDPYASLDQLLGYACVPNEHIGPAFDTLARVIERHLQARAMRVA